MLCFLPLSSFFLNDFKFKVECLEKRNSELEVEVQKKTVEIGEMKEKDVQKEKEVAIKYLTSLHLI
jgi:hypothetical protein